MVLSTNLLLIVLSNVDVTTLLRLRQVSHYRYITTIILYRYYNRIEVLSALPHISKSWDHTTYSHKRCYWGKLIDLSSLTIEFIEHNKNRWDKYDWLHVCRHPCLTPEIITRYLTKLNGSELSMHIPLTPKFIEACGEKLDWHCVNNNPHITLSFIEQHKEKLDIQSLSYNHFLSLDCIEQWKDQIVWSGVSHNCNLTHEFIDKYNKRLHWGFGGLSRSAHLTLSLIKKYEGRINWNELSHNKHLTAEIIDEYAGKGKWNWGHLTHNPCLEKCTVTECQEWVDRGYLMFNPHLTSNIFINKNTHAITWTRVSYSYPLHVETLSENNPNWGYISLEHLLAYKDIDLLARGIKRHEKKWDWKTLSYACLEYRWELILDYPEWPWTWG